jgi:hypothetical protein
MEDSITAAHTLTDWRTVSATQAAQAQINAYPVAAVYKLANGYVVSFARTAVLSSSDMYVFETYAAALEFLISKHTAQRLMSEWSVASGRDPHASGSLSPTISITNNTKEV